MTDILAELAAWVCGRLVGNRCRHDHSSLVSGQQPAYGVPPRLPEAVEPKQPCLRWGMLPESAVCQVMALVGSPAAIGCAGSSWADAARSPAFWRDLCEQRGVMSPVEGKSSLDDDDGESCGSDFGGDALSPADAHGFVHWRELFRLVAGCSTQRGWMGDATTAPDTFRLLSLCQSAYEDEFRICQWRGLTTLFDPMKCRFDSDEAERRPMVNCLLVDSAEMPCELFTSGSVSVAMMTKGSMQRWLLLSSFPKEPISLRLTVTLADEHVFQAIVELLPDRNQCRLDLDESAEAQDALWRLWSAAELDGARLPAVLSLGPVRGDTDGRACCSGWIPWIPDPPAVKLYAPDRGAPAAA
eukprot:TRINITY_DN50328_c0_g1_i1.p1 TRINITY_DN50328_c0_g1~~TRINITY_DN50328_c0_g1_i1.p1  ORF type:complete len:373 (+),score=69.30 TRINITY_DN50328_c0_g1_i1:52-1119(+)